MPETTSPLAFPAWVAAQSMSSTLRPRGLNYSFCFLFSFISCFLTPYYVLGTLPVLRVHLVSQAHYSRPPDDRLWFSGHSGYRNSS